MTRNDLKDLIKEVIFTEMRVRRNVAKSTRVIDPEDLQAVKDRMEAEKRRELEKAVDAAKAKEIENRPKDADYFDRQYINVKARIDKLNNKIKELENQMAIVANIPDRMEALNRQIDLVKIKIPLEIKRLEEFQNLEEIKVGLEKILKQSKI